MGAAIMGAAMLLENIRCGVPSGTGNRWPKICMRVSQAQPLCQQKITGWKLYSMPRRRKDSPVTGIDLQNLLSVLQLVFPATFKIFGELNLICQDDQNER